VFGGPLGALEALSLAAVLAASYRVRRAQRRSIARHLVPGRLIVQAWGSDQLGPGHLVVIAFDAVEGGTQVSLLHTGIPDDKLPLVDWEGRYWQPWRAALERRSTDQP
jgi:Activator of Hsp90 ATPase homolog 1-like protein